MCKVWVKRLTLFLATMMLVISALPLVAFAGTASTVVISGNDVNKMTTVFEKLQEEYGSGNNLMKCSTNSIKIMNAAGALDANAIEWSAGDGKLTFNGEVFESADDKAKRLMMTKFTEKAAEYDLTTTCRQNIADKFTEGSNEANSYMIGLALDSTSADIFTALKWLGPILQFMRIIIGVGAIVIILLLVASTVMDCVYIGLPMWREQQANKDGGSGKPFGVSMEALSTVKEIESNIEGGQYKNAYLLYFRRRALTYVILAICILYLIAGELGGLIQGLLNLATGFTS